MDADLSVTKYANTLERASWFLTLCAMLTQLSGEVAFPAYNVALGFWGAYCAFSKHGRSTFGFITFAFFAIILDLVFLLLNSAHSGVFQFCRLMLILCVLLKAYALYGACFFFTSIGGASSLSEGGYQKMLDGSMYDSLQQTMQQQQQQHNRSAATSAMHHDDDERGSHSNARSRDTAPLNRLGQSSGSQEAGGGYYPPNMHDSSNSMQSSFLVGAVNSSTMSGGGSGNGSNSA